ncbi:hypothetical protein T01_16168 [Trichinella spiralis]|uniref:Uncharacterized protein n=1 Tax=Trichinella spiralis TaxID=6334 RepID=A0A0V0YXE6_TRISP|nr:hypothetical protein T01_16168 [Trichinella spiralis]
MITILNRSINCQDVGIGNANRSFVALLEIPKI